jgi:branched-chain amino acid transport system ATP-binding protein
LDLRVDHLEVRYGDLLGIADVWLQVRSGTVVALLGSNGAGKTTTLNAIMNLARPSRGSIIWRGESIGGRPAFAILRRGLALSPEGWRLFVSQTVEQNLRRGVAALAERAHYLTLIESVYHMFPRLAERQHGLGTCTDGRPAAAPA